MGDGSETNGDYDEPYGGSLGFLISIAVGVFSGFWLYSLEFKRLGGAMLAVVLFLGALYGPEEKLEGEPQVVEDPYLDFVKDQAKQQTKCFVLDWREGNQCNDESTGWHLYEMFGWLIPSVQEEALLKVRSGEGCERFDEFYVRVRWSINEVGKLKVHFEKV